MQVSTNPHWHEIERILLAHQRTRLAKTLAGMKRELTDEEMSREAADAGEPCKAESIASVRRILRLTMNDELVASPSDAESQAALYRELLNYPRSLGLTQHIKTRLSQLRQLDPNVKLTPLGHVRLGGGSQERRVATEQPCDKCFQIHRGECL